MAGFSSAARNAILELLFKATTWADIAENDTTSPDATIELALHTADPGAAGTMSTSEAAYTSYVRKSIARSGAGFVVTANSVSPAADQVFATATGSPSETETYGSLGKPGGGAVAIHMTGSLNPTIPVTAAGIIPRISSATAFTLT